MQYKNSSDNRHLLDISVLQDLLARRLFKASSEEASKINNILGVLSQAQRNGVQLRGAVSAGGALHFYLRNGREVKIRVATIDDQRREHRLGLHRFKLIPAIASYDFAVFSMMEGLSIVTYIFKTSEIAQLTTLGLRYKWFERKSVYDYARDRWSILAK